jgi:hypothetical protein
MKNGNRGKLPQVPGRWNSGGHRRLECSTLLRIGRGLVVGLPILIPIHGVHPPGRNRGLARGRRVVGGPLPFRSVQGFPTPEAVPEAVPAAARNAGHELGWDAV